ncbi:hypothetical protein ABV409_15225 [Flagellimonas sp. DF-77]|uniref:hypothetical protein n=1 Tax=Flagellimonas algarum TaxID=3230298 RepID=UPI0033933A2A
METIQSKIARTFGLILAGILALSMGSCATGRNQSIAAWERTEWQAISNKSKEEGSITLARRQLGKREWEYRISGQIGLTPKQALLGFEEAIHAKAGAPASKEYPIYDLQRKNDSALLVYMTHKESFPFRDTELCVRYTRTKADNANQGLRWETAWPDCTTNTDRRWKRVERFEGAVQFTALDQESSRMTQTIRFDLKGMPLWLAHTMVVTYLKKAYRELRQTVSENQKQSNPRSL